MRLIAVLDKGGEESKKLKVNLFNSDTTHINIIKILVKIFF